MLEAMTGTSGHHQRVFQMWMLVDDEVAVRRDGVGAYRRRGYARGHAGNLAAHLGVEHLALFGGADGSVQSVWGRGYAVLLAGDFQAAFARQRWKAVMHVGIARAVVKDEGRRYLGKLRLWFQFEPKQLLPTHPQQAVERLAQQIL